MSDGANVLVGYLYLTMIILLMILNYVTFGIEFSLVVGILGCLFPILGFIMMDKEKKD